MRSVLFVLFLLISSCWAFCPAVADGEIPEGLDEAYEMHADMEGEIVKQAEEHKLMENSKSMSELIDAATSKKMDAIFTMEGKKTTLLALLQYLLKETKIDSEYLTNLFHHAAKVESNEELEGKIRNENMALKFLSRILQHFQKNPDAGRPAGESETSAEQSTEETESDVETESTTTEKTEDDGAKDEL